MNVYMDRCMNEGWIDGWVKMNVCIQDRWMDGWTGQDTGLDRQGFIHRWMKEQEAAMLDQKTDAIFWSKFMVKLQLQTLPCSLLPHGLQLDGIGSSDFYAP